MRPPYGRKHIRRPDTPPPIATSPRFEFLSPTDANGRILTEPPEVTRFKEIVTDDPQGLKNTLDTMRQIGTPPPEALTSSEIGSHIGTITNLLVSPQWDKSLFKFDPTTDEDYLRDPRTKKILKEIHTVEDGSGPHIAYKLELRIIRLATYATRVAAAAQLEQLSGVPSHQRIASSAL